MILKMEKLFLHGHSDDKQEILNTLMGLDCVQMIPPEELYDTAPLEALCKKDTPKVYDDESRLSEIAAALALLKDHEPKAGMFSKKNELSYEEMLDLSDIDSALRQSSVVRGIAGNISEVKSFQSQEQFNRQALLPWKEFDLPLQALVSKTCETQFFTLPKSADLPALSQSLGDLGVVVEVISEDKDLFYLAVVLLKSACGEAGALLKENSALSVVPPASSGTVAENIGYIDKRLEDYSENHKVLLESLCAHAQDTKLLKQAHDRLSTAIGSQRAKQNLLLTEQTFFTAAWAASQDKPKIEKALSRFGCFYTFSEVPPEEEPPVRFKNNSLVQPFEVITEMYGLPHPTTLDPDPLIAPFFFLFFGMMLSDAGYGILLVVFGFLMAARSRKGTFGNKLFHLIGLCGISTIIWGAIYGSWFGDVITTVSKTFFGLDITVPALINPLDEPMTIMIMSFAFGAVHLFVGMGVKAYLLIRRGHPWIALFDVGFWYFVLIGLVLLFLGGLARTVGMVLAITGALGLILTQGRDKENIFMRLMSGVMSLYDITGYFSDVLSYSRILALGLATGVIASVINTLATLPGVNIIGTLLFLVIFAGGHLFNLGINALGSYVHTSRLQYVEFFGKFFEGGGKVFTPLGPTVKYNVVNFKED